MNDTRGVVLECFRRLGTWDADHVGELFAEDLDWNVPGSTALPWTGARSRRADVAQYFRTLWSHLFTEQTRVVLDALVVDGEEAVQLGAFDHVARPKAHHFHTDFAMRFTVRNGLIVRLHLYEDTYAVALAFGAQTPDRTK